VGVLKRLRRLRLGPGLITGAADDDPSGIATYSQAGAQFGFGLLWTVVLTLPLMVAIQMVSARIGHVTGRGLAANIRAHFPRPVVMGVVGLLLAANMLNIAADIAAMAEALRLVAGGPAQLYAAAAGALCVGLQIFLPYERYVRWLKWLTISLFAYVAVVFTLHIDWWQVAINTVWPGMPAGHDMLLTVVAVLGTTISPYLFFWQAAQEMEDTGRGARAPRPAAVRRQLRRIRWDTALGMGFSNLIAFFIMLTAAATLHTAGVHDIATSAQAAEALRPLAGELTFVLFALGIVGTGLLAVPVLAGSAAYAVAEAAGQRASLRFAPGAHEGRAFHAVLAIATFVGVAFCYTGVDPVKELFWAAVLNGIIAAPIMAVMMLLAGRPEVLGDYVIGRRLRWLGWLATAAMAAGAVAMMASG
jgi:NRAMP (natural resistance-associated macrophage protein)-like metal ion transporter